MVITVSQITTVICKMKKSREVAELVEWAELVLPWLPPPDLASISSTCKNLHHIANSITTRRASDASRGFEKHPIPFLNPTDSSQPYSYFLYTRFPILCFSSPPPSSQSQPWGGNFEKPISDPSSLAAFSVGNVFGCLCSDCSLEECPCSNPNPDSFSGLDGEIELMTECGVNCDCGLECGNRLTQRGVSVRLRIVRDAEKGWGLHAAQFIRKGEFVCEYAGEFLTTEEARRRQRMYDELASAGRFSPALLVVREHLSSGKACLRVNIDASKIGNVARFINHSCDGGNLLTSLVRNPGSLLPRICFFAAADILEGEELTFSYGDVRIKPNGLPCFCGSAVCSGVLPSEET